MTAITYLDYVVSFNTNHGDYELGDYDMDTIDYHGRDLEDLAKEVCTDDPSFPLTFRKVNDGDVVGEFYDASDDEYPVAIMVEGGLC